MTDWGPEIEVNGKRPEWLRDGVTVRLYNAVITDTWWDSPYHKGHGYNYADTVHWQGITHIRLPADHPHYKKDDDVPDWAKVWAYRAAYPHSRDSDQAIVDDWDDMGRALHLAARYIAQHEEPPVDPLLLEAREFAKVFFVSQGWPAGDFDKGWHDESSTVKSVYKYLKRKADAKQG